MKLVFPLFVAAVICAASDYMAPGKLSPRPTTAMAVEDYYEVPCSSCHGPVQAPAPHEPVIIIVD